MKPVRNIFSLHVDAEWPRQHLDVFANSGWTDRIAPPPPKPRYTLTIRYGAEAQHPDERPVLLRMWGDGIELGGDETHKALAAMIERANRPEVGRPPLAEAVAEAQAPTRVFLSDLTIKVFSDDPETLVEAFYKGDPVPVNVIRDRRPPM